MSCLGRSGDKTASDHQGDTAAIRPALINVYNGALEEQGPPMEYSFQPITPVGLRAFSQALLFATAWTSACLHAACLPCPPPAPAPLLTSKSRRGLGGQRRCLGHRTQGGTPFLGLYSHSPESTHLLKFAPQMPCLPRPSPGPAPDRVR